MMDAGDIGPSPPRGPAALFLDLDGTLLDIAPRPDLVRVPAGFGRLLERLASRLNGALAIVTGRSAESARPLLDGAAVVLAAEHGAVIEAPGLPPLPLPVPEPAWREEALRFAAAWPGTIAEQKRHGFVIHVRQNPAAAEPAAALVAALAARAPDRFRLATAHAAVELRPLGADKGGAVQRLMRSAPFAGRLPVFLGDDATDEDGIAAAVALGGAGFRVPDSFGGDTARVRAWLERVFA
jgi:trehalose 6-phosphate phosphatase